MGVQGKGFVTDDAQHSGVVLAGCAHPQQQFPAGFRGQRPGQGGIYIHYAAGAHKIHQAVLAEIELIRGGQPGLHVVGQARHGFQRRQRLGGIAADHFHIDKLGDRRLGTHIAGFGLVVQQLVAKRHGLLKTVGVRCQREDHRCFQILAAELHAQALHHRWLGQADALLQVEIHKHDHIGEQHIDRHQQTGQRPGRRRTGKPCLVLH